MLILRPAFHSLGRSRAAPGVPNQHVQVVVQQDWWRLSVTARGSASPSQPARR